MNRTISLLSFICLISCMPQKKTDQPLTNTIMPDTTAVQLQLYTVQNKNGLRMTVTNFGGRIVSLWVPDKKGKLGDIVLGYDSLEEYLTGNPYYGALIGRYGNRIARGKFTIDGVSYQLATNDSLNALHGGPMGFHNVFWKVQPVMKDTTVQALQLTYHSVDGEEGYPGNLDVKVIYTLNDLNELIIDYEATTDEATILNLTHHSFFNLAGAGNGNILDHELTINASGFTPIDATLIPTGEIRPVAKTPFDFTQPHKIGERIGKDDEQLKNAKGYDHNWVLNTKPGDFSLAATVREPLSGRVMEVWTSEPGLQFYSGNFLTAAEVGKGGKVYDFRTGFCLEAQHFPDSPNKSNFPNTVLRPGEVYTQRTVYKFW